MSPGLSFTRGSDLIHAKKTETIRFFSNIFLYLFDNYLGEPKITGAFPCPVQIFNINTEYLISANIIFTFKSKNCCYLCTR